MNDFGTLCRTIQACEKLVHRLAEAERRLADIPWYRWMQRRGLRQRITSLRGEIETLNSRISEEHVQGLANYIGSVLWDRAAAKIVPKKNPYGSAALAQITDIRDLALKNSHDYEFWDHRSGASFPLGALPEVKEMITSTFIESNARREINELAVIAASPELIHEYDRDYEGKLRLWVQHVASGLRAVFTLHGDGFGRVESKSYKLGSIDPQKPGTLDDWGRYTGLGIGRRLYEKAHELEPTVRWGAGVLSEYSAPLRRRLHSADPYVWDWSSCLWCDANLRKQGIHHWMDASRSSFVGHP
jgi:hypothetical protein